MSIAASPAGACWAVLVAAGRGERLGEDRPKAFVRLGDLPLLAEPLRRLDESDWIDAVVLVAPPEWEEPAILLAEELGASKVTACVTGGATRTESVRAGVAEVPDDAAVILVHDAARPLLADDVIGRVVGALAEGFDGAVPGLPVVDTVKRVRDDAVHETLVRDELVTVQTPQCFRASALREALGSGVEGSDCASLVEANGGRIKVVAGRRAAAQGDDAAPTSTAWRHGWCLTPARCLTPLRNEARRLAEWSVRSGRSACVASSASESRQSSSTSARRSSTRPTCGRASRRPAG